MKKTPTVRHAPASSFLRSALQLFSLSALLCLSAHAAAPQIVSLRASPVSAGQTLEIIAEVTDSDNPPDLDYINFYIKGPSDAIFQLVGSANINGPRDHATARYPVGNAYGLYTVKATAYDLTTSTTVETQTEVYSGSYTIPPLTIANGEAKLITSPGPNGELLTTATTNGAPTTQVQSGGTLVLWAGGRITLKAGFHALPGSNFWAAIDHDGDGYSDLEEQQDTDGDGMFDAWEVDHGLNMLANDAALDPDNDGFTNLQEFLAGTNPQDHKTRPTGPPGGGAYQPIAPPTGPSGYDVILKLPSTYLGFARAAGTLTSIAAP